MAHVSQLKKTQVKDLIGLFREYPIIAAVNMENLPAKQLQKMRSQLRGSVVLRMAKRRLIQVAINEVKKEKAGIEQLEPYLVGMPAVIFTKENPFKLFKTLKKNKSSAPAKPGQIAPHDIMVPAGGTNFSPGPIIGELGMLGVKTKVEGGKVAIISDTTVCHEGDVITPALAGMLLRLGITPMEIGLDLTAVYEDGAIFGKKVLDIDEAKFMNDLSSASRNAVLLAVETGYPAKEVIELMITRCNQDGRALAKEIAFPAEGVVGDLLARSEAEMAAIAQAAGIDLAGE